MKRLDNTYKGEVVIEKPTVNKNEIFQAILEFAKQHARDYPELYILLRRYNNDHWDWGSDDPEVAQEFDDILNKFDTIAPEGTKFISNAKGQWGFFPIALSEVNLQEQISKEDIKYLIEKTAEEGKVAMFKKYLEEKYENKKKRIKNNKRNNNNHK